MNQTIATVNGVPIDDKALSAAMQSLSQEQFHAPIADVSADRHEELKAMALERLVARELIYQLALAEGFLADDQAVEAETQRILRLMGNPKDFWSKLEQKGMDQASFIRMVRKDVTVDQMTARYLEKLPEPEEEEIVRFFKENPDKIREPERVSVNHILVSIEEEGAEKALASALALKEEAELKGFSETARLHSVCASAPGGGSLGKIRRQDVDPTFAEVAFTQPIGAISEPFRTPYGYHLVKIDERDIPSPPTLDEARPRILGFLKKLKGAKLLEEWIAELRQAADIKVLGK
jgi:peptidyl-prolyl cis-trans isomerase C